MNNTHVEDRTMTSSALSRAQLDVVQGRAGRTDVPNPALEVSNAVSGAATGGVPGIRKDGR